MPICSVQVVLLDFSGTHMWFPVMFGRTISLEGGGDASRRERPAAGGWLLSFDGERRRRCVLRLEGIDARIRCRMLAPKRR